MQKSAINFVKKQIKYLEKSKKINHKIFNFIYFLLAIINLAIVVITIVALVILLKSKENQNSNNTKSIIMAAITAGITLLIFLFHIINLIYKNYMKWGIYKEAIDKIEVEYVKYINKEAEYKSLNKQAAQSLFEKQCLSFYEGALAFKKNGNKRKLLSQAIIGDYYD